MMKLQLPVLVLLQGTTSGAFVVPWQQPHPTPIELCAISRRSVMGSIVAAVPFFASSSPAMAKDELFKANPLTNGVLEQIRIWDQASADQLKYGGELTAGDDGNRGKVDQYPQRLVPILEIAADIGQVYTLVQDSANWPTVQQILSNAKYDKLAFKKIFNAYGDNIYYSDPDRANVYLGGGATPRNEQSLAYLLRNDLLTNIEYLQAEVAFLLKDSTPVFEKEHPDDLYMYARAAEVAMSKYMELVPPDEVVQAKLRMKSKASV